MKNPSRVESWSVLLGWGAWSVLALLLGGCAGEERPLPPPPPPTWHRDIAPLVQRSCSSCHDGKGVGGVALTQLEVARALSNRMAERVTHGEMPPPVSDPGCRSYEGAERMTLTTEERALIAAWAEAGAPTGDPSEAPPPQSWSTHITQPDQVLSMPFAHTIVPDADGSEYFCVTLTNPFTQSTWITGLEAELGNSSVVHHMALFKDLSGDAGVRHGATDASRGFNCRDPITELDWMLLHSWAPGMGATLLPEGTGLRVEPGEQLVLQVHYHSGQAGPTDRSGYKLRTTTEPQPTEVYMDAVGPVGFTLPAGAARHVASEARPNTGGELTIYGMLPHMHLLGKSYRAWLDDGAGGRTCLTRGAYDFQHQALYLYKEPVRWKPGQSFVTECTWDNSTSNPNQLHTPPQDISWGESTNQEMCFMMVYLSGG